MLRTITEKFDFLRGHSQSTKSVFYNFLCIILSALLLVLAFPRTDYWILAWIGLVPLLHVLDGQRAFKAFQMSFLTGFVFFILIFHWLSYVSTVGLVLLSLYAALYFGFFGLVFYVYNREKIWVKVFGISSAWVVLEYLRGILFSGFDWGSLAYSQYTNLIMIQSADVVGKFGVSFLIAMVNVLIYELLKRGNVQEKIRSIVLVSIFVAVAYGYGHYRLAKINPDTDYKKSIVVGLVQGNIMQENKWNEVFYPQILGIHNQLTLQAALDRPDLIIWPETSFPGYWGEDAQEESDLRAIVKTIQTPLLFGTVAHVGDQYFNSALLLSKTGREVARYDKIRLVAFGEYLPFRAQLPWLTSVVPIEDFDAGKELRVFSSLPQGLFSVLICFEDSFASLPRQFVLQGAEMFIVLTNDAWFHDTKEAQMHLSESVFRAVENRRYFVRSANTGLSGVVDTKGNVTSTLKNKEHKSIFVDGVLTAKAYFNEDITFYSKFGDLFVLLCLLMIIFSIFV